MLCVIALAVEFGQMILIWVQLLNMFEVNGNSLERLQQYMGIEQEPKPVDSGIPPAYWPSSGSLKAETLSARYSPVCSALQFFDCNSLISRRSAI